MSAIFKKHYTSGVKNLSEIIVVDNNFDDFVTRGKKVHGTLLIWQNIIIGVIRKDIGTEKRRVYSKQ